MTTTMMQAVSDIFGLGFCSADANKERMISGDQQGGITTEEEHGYIGGRDVCNRRRERERRLEVEYRDVVRRHPGSLSIAEEGEELGNVINHINNHNKSRYCCDAVQVQVQVRRSTSDVGDVNLGGRNHINPRANSYRSANKAQSLGSASGPCAREKDIFSSRTVGLPIRRRVYPSRVVVKLLTVVAVLVLFAHTIVGVVGAPSNSLRVDERRADRENGATGEVVASPSFDEWSPVPVGGDVELKPLIRVAENVVAFEDATPSDEDTAKDGEEEADADKELLEPGGKPDGTHRRLTALVLFIVGICVFCAVVINTKGCGWAQGLLGTYLPSYGYASLPAPNTSSSPSSRYSSYGHSYLAPAAAYARKTWNRITTGEALESLGNGELRLIRWAEEDMALVQDADDGEDLMVNQVLAAGVGSGSGIFDADEYIPLKKGKTKSYGSALATMY